MIRKKIVKPLLIIAAVAAVSTACICNSSIVGADERMLTHRLTTNKSNDWCPRWSSSNKIVFLSRRTGNCDIFMINPNGSGLAQITESPANDWNFGLSLDGKRIAFVSHRTGQKDIWIININGTDLKQLTSGAEADLAVWSLDGSKIAFDWRPNGGDYGIWVMNPDGSDKKKLTDLPGVEGWASWSPDGSKIAFYHGDSWKSCTIWVMDGDGSNLKQLTKYSEPRHRWGVAWSPDGKKIIFQSKRSGNWDI